MNTETTRGIQIKRGVLPMRPCGSWWVVPAALAVPFVIAVAALQGLTATLPIFHGSDELVYHVPTILRFGGQLPFPDLGNYKAAQTPLFHLLLAGIGKLIGYELWRLRLVEVLISYGLALAVFGLLHQRLGLDRVPALALTLLFILSPYVYGASFRVVTDNLATLFVVLAVERLEHYRETGRLGPFLAACVSIAAAMLTRQSAAFMLGVAGLYALKLGPSHRERWLALGALGLATAPIAALVLVWHGLVPPGGDPSSCGLCASGHGGMVASLRVQSAELTLATIGLYGAVLFAPLVAWPTLRDRAARVQLVRGPLAGAAAGALLLVLWPALPGPGITSAGLLWNVARRLPAIDHTSVLFWALVPLSGAILWARVRVAARPWLPLTFLACFLVGSLTIRVSWQKYVDPYALLVLLFTVQRDEFLKPRELAGAAALAVGFVAYTLSFVT
jgi:4-amino-4-deoxy-L-arabinose transferase-like glycosyltransferase